MASQATTLTDLNLLFKSMMKSALVSMLNSEMDHHLKNPPATWSALPATAVAAAAERPTVSVKPKGKNRRNGHSPKTVSGDMGEMVLAMPRDRDGTFEPLVIPKYQRRIEGVDEKILALSAKRMTTRDIQDIVKQLYDVDVSPTLISDITSDSDAMGTAWRSRRLETIYPLLYLDGIVMHDRSESGKVIAQTKNVALGLNFQGKKELLGLWLVETEGAKFWLH